MTRPGKWGNPFKVGDLITPSHPHWHTVTSFAPWVPPNQIEPGQRFGWQDYTVETVEQAVAMFDEYLERCVGKSGWALIEEARAELRGHDLCCWCPLDRVCHADHLLNVVNQ